MRYVPNLIPEKSKILKDYFKGNIYHSSKPNQFVSILSWIVGIFFLLGAITSVLHPLLALLFGLLGFTLLPLGHRWVERTLRFRLTTKAKSIFFAALFVAAVPLSGHYDAVDKQEAYQQKLKTEQDEIVKAAAERKDQQRKDSLNFYVQESNRYGLEHKADEASKQLSFALRFASTEEEKSNINRQRIKISSINVVDLVKSGKYQAALPELNSLISQDASNADLFYNRAICYSKTGEMQEAVNDCRTAMQNGSKEAENLYDKINPVRKRITGYETLCNDGTTSDARGSGACSHHGGVANWNHPIYEEYRKYN